MHPMYFQHFSKSRQKGDLKITKSKKRNTHRKMRQKHSRPTIPLPTHTQPSTHSPRIPSFTGMPRMRFKPLCSKPTVSTKPGLTAKNWTPCCLCGKMSARCRAANTLARPTKNKERRKKKEERRKKKEEKDTHKS